MGRLAILLLLLIPQDPAPQKGFASEIDAAVLTLPNMPARLAVMNDVEFIHRVWTDLLGQKPPDEEVRAFPALADPDKRSKKVDELLASPKFGEFWAKRLAESWLGDLEAVRLEKVDGVRPDAARKVVTRYVEWLGQQLNQDRPYVDIVREMVVARGKAEDHPELGYKLAFFRGKSYPEEFSMGLSRGLLGIRLYCAQCHDHPFDRWTVENFHGLAAFVARERVRPAFGSDPIELKAYDEGEKEIGRDPNANEKNAKVKLAQGGTAQPVFLFGGAAGKNDDRTQVLANLLTSKANTQLPRAFVNRVWGWVFRRGIVHPVDDFNLRNKAFSPVLLSELTRGFAESGHSVKSLLREICRTRIYQVPDATGPDESDLVYLRGLFRKPETARALPKGLPKFPDGWKEDTRARGWPHYNYRIPDKEGKAGTARLWVSRYPTAVEDAFRQLVGAKPKIETIQGKQEIKLGDGVGTMYCDSEAGAPLQNERLIFARLGTGNGLTFRLEGPAETVGDWRDELIEILKGIEP